MRTLRAHEARAILHIYSTWTEQTRTARLNAAKLCLSLRKNGWIPTPQPLLVPVVWPAVACAIARIARSYDHKQQRVA